MAMGHDWLTTEEEQTIMRSEPGTLNRVKRLASRFGKGKRAARSRPLWPRDKLLVLFQLSSQVDVPAGDLDLALPRLIPTLLHRDHVLAVSERKR